MNKERKAKRHERDFGELADYVRGLDCTACGAGFPSDPAHVKSQGAGGHAWTDAGHGNLIPLCRKCHGLQHQKGWGALRGGGREWAELMARTIGEAFRTFVEES